MVVPTRRVDPARAQNYLKKAGELYLDMLESHRNGRFNSTVISAIHCGISSSDAFNVHTQGMRSMSKNHGDAIRLLSSIGPEARRMSEHLRWLIEVKNAAEYEERLFTSKEADMAVKHAERLYRWAKEKLAPG